MIRKPRLGKGRPRSVAPGGFSGSGFGRRPDKGRGPASGTGVRFDRPVDVGQSQRDGTVKGLKPAPLKPIDTSTKSQPMPLDPVRYETFSDNIRRNKRGR